MVVEFDKDVLKKAKTVFKYRGSIKAAAKSTGIDRTSIPRVLKAKTAEERIVNALSAYINQKSIPAA